MKQTDDDELLVFRLIRITVLTVLLIEGLHINFGTPSLVKPLLIDNDWISKLFLRATGPRQAALLSVFAWPLDALINDGKEPSASLMKGS